MTGFLAFALAAIALVALIAGQVLLGVLCLGGAAVCFLLVGRYAATRR